MIYDLNNEYDLPLFKERVHLLIDKGKVVELTERKPSRTTRQNSYLHLILSWFAMETGYSLEEVKQDYFKRLCNPQLFCEEHINKRGVLINRLRSIRCLNTSEMTTAIDRFRNWSAANGLYLPSPCERESLLHIEKEIERCKEYL